MTYCYIIYYIHTHTHTHSYSNFLIGMISVGLASAHSNHDCLLDVYCVYLCHIYSYTFDLIHTCTCTYCMCDNKIYSETPNNRLSERRTTSVQQTNSMPPIVLPSTFGTSKKWILLYFGQRTASMPPKDCTK